MKSDISEAAGIAAPPAKDRAVKPSRRRRRGEVRIFRKWCKGCGLCMAFCPERVFSVDGEGRAVVAHPEKCTACMWCYHHCPDFAIAVYRSDEDASGASEVGD
jgi:2-oxoglutarate ferredoxin oxidoreductase subunit delta